jgi:hypothetical protein
MAIRYYEAMTRVIAPPTASGDIHFSPGMQVALIHFRISLLVAAHEPGCKTKTPAYRHKQYNKIAAGPSFVLKGYGGR